jgi:hypothetical protein
MSASEKAQPVPPSDAGSRKIPEDTSKGIIRGTISYPYGTVKGAKIALGEAYTLSDAAGNYEFTALNPGSYSVVAEPPFPGYEASLQTVELEAGITQIVDIYFDFKKAVVEGRVYDQEDKPIVGATLSGVLSGKDMESVTTDERGSFRFGRVTPGDRFIRVNAPGFLGETRDFKAVENEPTTLEFHLEPATSKISGTITDDVGRPLRAEVLLMKGGIVVQKTTSNPETGCYDFPVVPGRYEILLVIPGYITRGWSGSITADTKADFSLKPMPRG